MIIPLRRLPAAVILLGAAIGCGGGGAASPGSAADAVGALYLARLDTLSARIAELESALDGPDPAPAAREAFARSRAAYKRLEFLLEYYAPASAEEINGPALDEVEEDDPNRVPVPPSGFQVIEELLYPELHPSSRADAATETRILRATVERARRYAESREYSDANVWEAMRLELARIVALGVSGFDSPVALRSVEEARDAVVGIRSAAEIYAAHAPEGDERVGSLLDALAAMERFLAGGSSFDDFDRLTFVRDHLHPTTAALVAARDGLGIPAPEERRAWRADATSLFSEAAFDPSFFAAPGTSPPTAAQVELGRRLFFDPVLSGERRACSSCHVPELAFTDGAPRSRPLASGSRAVLRNAPTVINSALQAGAFADLRTAYLEDQVSDVVRNRDEMHGDLDAAARAVLADPGYAQVIHAAYPRGATELTGNEVRQAIAAYLRSLVAIDSRFDRHVRGEGAELTASEKRGFNVFMGKAKCGTCHFAPLFNGTVPPAFAEAEVEVIGVPESTRNARVDPDPGRAAITQIPLHRHAFKTPTVRNAELTAPYMHNGVYRTLEEVVDFYDAGGGAGLGLALEHQTLPPDSLRLSPAEKRDLVAFMRALTDTTGVSAPATRR